MRSRTILTAAFVLSLLLSVHAGLRAEPVVSPDGAWTTFSSFKNEFDRYPQAFHDPVDDRLLSLLGDIDNNGTPPKDVFALDLSAPAWSRLVSKGEGPPSGSAIYDPVRHRILVVTHGAATMRIWALGLTGTPAWTLLAVAGTVPANRTSPAIAYDSGGDRVLLIGGFRVGSASGEPPLRETWSLDLSPFPAWTQLATAGIPNPDIPSFYGRAASIYDPTGRRVMVYTGAALFELALEGLPTWRQVPTYGSEPPDLIGASLIHDAPRQRMILFGGSISNTRSNATWTYDLAGPGGWTQLAPGGPAPTPRQDHGAIYDPVRQRMIVIGGSMNTSGAVDYTVALDLAGSPVWTEMMLGETVPRGNRTTWLPVFDAGDRLLTILDPLDPRDLGWRLAVDAPYGWARLSESPDTTVTPLATFHDPARNVWIVIASSGSWAVSLGNPLAWSPLPIPIGPLAGRTSFASAYDGDRDRWLVFGGQSGSSFLNDLWALNLASLTWSTVATSGTRPSPRRGAAMVVDAVHDHLYVHGGQDSLPLVLGDTYRLPLTGSAMWFWLQTTNYSRREGAFLAHDTARDRLLLTGGIDPSNYASVWALPLSAPVEWTQLSPTGTPPSIGGIHFHDPVGDRLLVVTSSSNPPFVKSLSFSADDPPGLECPAAALVVDPGVNPSFYLVTNPSPHATEYDFVLTSTRDWPGFPLTGRKLIDGGASSFVQLGVPVPDTSLGPTTLRFTVWERGEFALADSCDHPFGLGTAFTPPVAVRLSLEGARPNPVSGALNIVFSLPDGEPARLEAFDVTGRRVADRDVGSFGPGRHVVRLAESSALRPGIYLVRLSQSRRSFTTRACVVR